MFSVKSNLARSAKAKKTALGVAVSGLAIVAGGVAIAPSASAAPATAPAAAAKSGSVNTWINQSLKVMKAHGIPGTYQGIYKNLMRESGGNPNAINNWDSNAAKGIPSK